MLHQLNEYVTTANNRYSSISFYSEKMPGNTVIYAYIYMPTSNILTVKQKEITEGEYYILNNLPFVHHLHGNSH